ncbi:C45 family autoproteolytic acyltransferase/hydolase [Limnohabitans radicicola]|uniref:Peptidase C45 n=1 Tax=Limnohabitans radicicola TaxID=2771427 RepID=A0A927FFG3_9BURK|nr:C45 family peptidase [Limnohabitans radicicola]MBD8049562.1 peptidase C45 [Limnohabitans radicicola]
MFPSILVPSNLSAHNRGLFYGQAARAQTLHSRNTYARLFASCGISWAQACDKAMAYREVIEQLDPALLHEMQGIAHGSGLTLADIMALNCRTEILPANFLSDATHQADAALQANRDAGLPDWLGDAPIDPAAAEGECTAMAVAPAASREGNTWLAQNWDWLGRQREALVLLHSGNEAGQRFTTLTEGGMLAKIGMNTQGFALGLNILRSLEDGVRPGVPVHVLLRHLLGCASLGAARAALARIGQSLGFGAASNVPCADAQGEVACFEVAPAGWGEVPPAQGVVVHTNHFVCASLLSTQAPMGVTLSSQPRLATAQQYAAQSDIDQAALENFLRDETDGHLSICRSPDMALPPEGRVESVAGVIMNTSTRQMWIAPDVPSRCAFEPVILPH